MIEVHKCIRRPKTETKFFAGDEFAGLSEQDCENFKGLPDELDSSPFFP
jgi:hypothetical protein